MRLFVAIRLEDELKSVVTAAMHDLKKAGVKGSFVPSQNLHLTMAFIGETKETAAVKAALQSVSFKPFRLTLTELGSFGDLIWIGTKGNQGLSAAVRSVRSTLDAAGIDYDRKKFVPHITIVRKASGNYKSVTVPTGEMTVKQISLMKSELKDGKRVYTEIMGV